MSTSMPVVCRAGLSCILILWTSDWHHLYPWWSSTLNPIFTLFLKSFKPPKPASSDCFVFFESLSTPHNVLRFFFSPPTKPAIPSIQANLRPPSLFCSANWICSWLLIKSRADLHKVRSFAYGRQPLPLRPYMSERLARSQRQGWKLTSEREIRREEGTDGGGEGELSANKGEEKTADGGRKVETNGGKQQFMPWDGE